MKHYRINEIKLPIDADENAVLSKLMSKLKLQTEDVFKWELRRKSIDARDKHDVHLVYAGELWTNKSLLKGRKAGGRDAANKQGRCDRGDAAIKQGRCDRGANTIADDNRPVKINGLSVQEIVEEEMATAFAYGDKPLTGRPVVVGMGPCGLFAALELARHGYKPLVIERGPEMADRIADVERFRQTGLLNPEGNMLFGEGGAGTFSDGKLGTGIKDGRIRDVLGAFADAGAGEEIRYLNKPHVGTDVLRKVIVTMRKQLIELGGEIRFNTKLEQLNIEADELKSVLLRTNTGAGISCERDVYEQIEANALVLAIGHSARDSFAMLKEQGLSMQQKPFSIGVRMEHPQSLIDEAQYGAEAIEKYGNLLPPADYKLSTKCSNGRGVYSFCMCPGGEVVVCSNAEGELCVNGMSNRGRDSGTANSGILCDVRCEDYNGGDESDVLAGVRFQEKYEKLAYENGKRCATKVTAPFGEAAMQTGTTAEVVATFGERAGQAGATAEVIATFGERATEVTEEDDVDFEKSKSQADVASKDDAEFKSNTVQADVASKDDAEFKSNTVQADVASKDDDIIEKNVVHDQTSESQIRRFNPPNCRMEDFLRAEGEEAVAVINSLPDFAAEAIREAVPTFAHKLKGYDMPEAIISAVETRSSSPVRIVRGADGQSNIKGIYPAGEGAGYAGGITSAACDGVRAAENLMRQFASMEPPRI